MSLVLGIESTCDETGAAVVDSGGRVAANVVASSADLHAVYGGVVPEIASRACVEAIGPVVDEALRQAGVSLADVDAVAVANRPGLIGSLVVGVTAAKTLAWAAGKPLVGVDHVAAHLHSVTLDNPNDVPLPAVGLVASGGHTALYHVGAWDDIRRLGQTRDDAVGEAYDKVASLLGLGYPGGPVLDDLAQHGDPQAVKFPRTMLDEPGRRDSLDFSFSGLKTAVLYHVRGKSGRERSADDLTDQQRADVAASFQAACVDVLVTKIGRAAEHTGAYTVLVGGGVSANRGLRRALAERVPAQVFTPHLRYCTDNAAMIAGLGAARFDAGHTDLLDLPTLPMSAIE